MAAPSPPAETSLSKAEKLGQLRRKIASIPARSDGTEPAAPSVMLHPVGEREPRPIVATAQSTLRMLPVPPPIADLLPRGGLTCGTVVSVDGAASVLIGLLATVTAGGGHAAVIGMPKLELLAGVDRQGAHLAKIGLVPKPEASAIEVAAILLEGHDLVVLGLSGQLVSPSRARAVIARARSKGAVLVVTNGHWDGPDLRIESRVFGYSGIGQGHGRVTAVQLEVAAAGRGFQRRIGRMEISGDAGSVTWRTIPDIRTSITGPLRAAQ